MPFAGLAIGQNGNRRTPVGTPAPHSMPGNPAYRAAIVEQAGTIREKANSYPGPGHEMPTPPPSAQLMRRPTKAFTIPSMTKAATPHGVLQAQADGENTDDQLAALLTGNDDPDFLGRVLTKLELSSLSFRIGSAYVLSDINLVLQQGQLVALMGESGSGKTTLLNVLGGRAGYGWSTGEMRLNSHTFHPRSMRHLLGYVPQAHLVFKELTVFENIMYAAKLRLHRSISTEKRQKVQKSPALSLDPLPFV